MVIVNGVKHYQTEIDAMVKFECNGWDSYDGNNYQWYTLYYNKDTGFTKLSATNSGSIRGINFDKYFNTVQEFVDFCQDTGRSIEELLGEIDENDVALMAFVEAVFPD